MANVKLAFNAAGFWSESETTGCRSKASSSSLNFVIGWASNWICSFKVSDLILQFIELRQHELLRLIPPRFLLPFADDDVAQHFIFFGELRRFLGDLRR